MENLNLKIENLLSSKEFTAQVNKIANDFGVGYNEIVKDDVRQACAIAVYESLLKYDANKVGGNFWGYAYLRMREYGKREVYNQRNIVHIPMNRTSEWAKSSYEEVKHSYEDLTWDDSHDKGIGAVENNRSIAMDIESVLNSLDEQSRYIVEVYSEIKPSKCGKTGFGAISQDLGISLKTVKEKYAAAQKNIAAHLL